MQSDVTRPRDRTPAPVLFENKNYVVEKILRFEIQKQWRVAMLLQNNRGAYRSFETVSFVSFNEFAKRSHGAAVQSPSYKASD